MNKKDNRRVQMTKQLMKDSLLEMLETEHIHKITIRALCERADVNRSTFYKYYGSQYDLLRDMEEDLLNEIEKILECVAQNENSCIHLNSILSFVKDNIKLCKILLNENTDADFQIRLLGLPAILDKLNVQIQEYDDIERVYIRKFILYGGYNMVVDWVKSDCQVDTNKITDIIMRVTMNAI